MSELKKLNRAVGSDPGIAAGNDPIGDQAKFATRGVPCEFTDHDHMHHFLNMLEVLIGVNQRLLQRTEENNGLSKGTILAFSQLTPVQGTAYSTPHTGYDGVLRNLVLSGSGNITVTLFSNHIPTGSMLIGTFVANQQIAHHITVPVDSYFSLATDAAAAAFIGLSAWIEPVGTTGQDFFRLRR